MRSPFSQREYAERHGISKALLSKWWNWLREDRARQERIKLAQCRRRRRVSPMTYDGTSHSTHVELTDYQQDLAERLVRRRRRFSDEEKRHFVREKLCDQGMRRVELARAADLADQFPDPLLNG
jgi:transposase-like protein